MSITIGDYFNNYKKYSASFPLKWNSGNSRTIKNFYDDFIGQIYQNPNHVANIIKWHEMLVEYSKHDDNIFWVRKYEAGINGNTNDNRRASVVEFADGFKIVYVCNFDAQEILNMALLGVEPDINEFTKMMKNYNYNFHFCDNNSCTEYYTHKYQHCGAHKVGLFSLPMLYLAHIRSVNEMPYFINGTSYDISRKNNQTWHDKLFPYGIKEDWTNSVDKIYHRKPNEDLTQDEKRIIKAHFLRFVDPLNYFPVPGENYHLYEYNKYSPHYKNIGEFPLMVSFMYKKMKDVFNTVDFDIFDELTLFNNSVLPDYRPNEEINIAYRIPKKYSKLTKTNKASKKKPKNSTASSRKAPRTSSGSSNSVGYRGKYYSKRMFVVKALTDFIIEKNIQSLQEFETYFPKIAKRLADIKDRKRYSDEITLPDGDVICISNQIGDKSDFQEYRNYTLLREKLVNLGFDL